MKQFIILIICFHFLSATIAQSLPRKNSVQYTFHSFNEAGMLIGKNKNALLLNSVNGFEKGKWFAGLGMGYDGYIHRSFPIFAQVNFDLFTKRNRLQLTASAGVNIAAHYENENLISSSSNFENGFYYAGGVQYLIPLQRDAIYFSAGFTGKQMVQKDNNGTFNPVTGLLENGLSKVEYSFKRIYVKVGFRL